MPCITEEHWYPVKVKIPETPLISLLDISASGCNKIKLIIKLTCLGKGIILYELFYSYRN